MDNGPENAAGAEREVKGEGEKEGESKLPWIDNRPDDADPNSHDRDDREQDRQSPETRGFDVFAFGRGHFRSFAHFLAASGLASGLVSAGLSISARCCSGTSAMVAFWLR